MSRVVLWHVLLATALLGSAGAAAATLEQVEQRRDADFVAGAPLVAHVVVALCDNEHQGIVPVPASLGNGTDPHSNLYWGAMFGVRSWFARSKDWKAVHVERSKDARVLERVLFRREVTRQGRRGDVFLLAEAWDGRYMADAIRNFLELNRGEHVESIQIGDRTIGAGGRAHVLAFVGHNGLMDSDAPTLAMSAVQELPHASVVLACMSDYFFAPLLREHSVPLLTTTGLMAPEAYTLDASLTAWFSGGDPQAVRAAAAGAYAHYQKTSEQAALRLFKVPTNIARP